MSKVAEAMKRYKVIVKPFDSCSGIDKALEEKGYVVTDGHFNGMFEVFDIMGLEPLENHFCNVAVLWRSVEENEEIITYLW